MAGISEAERLTLRDADESDAEFLAWVMLTASRSHLERGLWEYMYDHTEAQSLDLLARLLATETVHWCHYSRFLIAEVAGTPAAALSGYDPEIHGMDALMTVMPEVAAEVGITLDDYPAIMRRVSVITAVAPDNHKGAWVVEHVATRPEWRRRGLQDALMEAILDRGRSQGFSIAQIGVFIGNEPARRAYLKQGFSVLDDKRDRQFEAALGCPGIERLLRSI